MIRECVEKMYLPVAEANRRREADGGKLAKELDLWAQKLAENWNSLRFLGTKVSRDGEYWKFEVKIFLGEIDPGMINVEIYADGQNEEPPVRVAMAKRELISEMANGYGYFYEAKVPASRPSEHYTPRIVPYHPDAFIPLEESHILWEH